MWPILFELPGGRPIFSYGVMLGLSCVLGAHLAVYLSQRSGIERKRAWWFAVFVILVGLVGGRVHDLIVNDAPLSEWLKFQHSGRTAYGAFLSAIAGAVLGAKLFKVSFWRFADAAAPTMALGLGLTRIGCFMYGCDYGFQSEAWGVCFPRGSPAWTDQHDAGQIDFLAEQSLPVFPTQLPSSVVGFTIFAILMVAWFRRPRREGSILLLFLLTYGLGRAGLEVFRADAGRGQLMGLSTSTTIGLTTAVGAAAFLLVPALARLRGDAGPVLDLPDEDEPAAKPPAGDPPKRKPPKKTKQKPDQAQDEAQAS
jgi:phosphatidylglycerol:prolipoprotein diacylglycerol transferase